jgi:hypothetical protein
MILTVRRRSCLLEQFFGIAHVRNHYGISYNS